MLQMISLYEDTPMLYAMQGSDSSKHEDIAATTVFD
jgi:hypothetical protein